MRRLGGKYAQVTILSPRVLMTYVQCYILTLIIFLSDKWFYPSGAGKCDRVHDFAHLDPQYEHLEADNIVFSFQLPHPGSQLDYS